MYIYTHIYTYKNIYIYTHIYIYTPQCTGESLKPAHARAHPCTHTHTHTHTHTQFTNTHTRTHTYVHTLVGGVIYIYISRYPAAVCQVHPQIAAISISGFPWNWKKLHRNWEIAGLWAVGVWVHRDIWLGGKVFPVLEPNTNAQRLSCSSRLIKPYLWFSELI